MTPPLAILDIGATLVTGPDRSPWSRIAALLGLDAEAEATLRAALMTESFSSAQDVAAFVCALGDAPGEDVERVVTGIWDAQTQEAQPIAGAAKALLDLRDNGIRLAVISNIWEPYLRSVRICLGSFLDESVAAELQLFSYREGRAKPSLDLFELALERASTAPVDAVMIGDSYWNDIEPAARLGIGTVWVLRRPERERAGLVRVLNRDAPAPTRVLESIGDLTAAVVTSAVTRTAHLAHAQ